MEPQKYDAHAAVRIAKKKLKETGVPQAIWSWYTAGIYNEGGVDFVDADKCRSMFVVQPHTDPAPMSREAIRPPRCNGIMSFDPDCELAAEFGEEYRSTRITRD